MDQIEKNKVDIINGTSANGQSGKGKRLDVMKTYKLYIDGKFPRTESGKDFREAVVAARKAQPGWASKSAYNKGQILYRIAEMLEGRKSQFI